MYYNFAILLLFAPFFRFRIFTSQIVPFQICIQSANAIDSLLNSYGRLYDLRRTPCFTPIISLASNIMHLVQAEIQGSPSPQLLLGVSTLQKMAYSHSFAKRGVNILYKFEQHRALATGKASDSSSDGGKSSLYRYSKCTMCFVEAGIEDLPPSQANPLHTSIFTPFPSQVESSIESALELQRLGFELLSM